MNPPPSQPACILVVGPTAGGKTGISLALARALPHGGECVGADSMQVYRGMDIGTAKPTLAEQSDVPHHLLNVVEPDEPFTVDHWLGLAEEAVRGIRDRGHHPVIVGGTNLYIQAFLAGLMDGPAPDEALRSRLQALDTAALRESLERVDPEAATRIHANDRRRTIRALEVHQLTGEPISARQEQWARSQGRTDTVLLGLHYPPEAINRRINARVRAMMDKGLLDEVDALYRSNRLGPQAIEALGYRQLVDHIEGRMSLDEAVEQIKVRTRRFAKQQRAWLKRFQAKIGGCWIECGEIGSQVLVNKSVESVLAHPLMTP